MAFLRRSGRGDGRTRAKPDEGVGGKQVARGSALPASEESTDEKDERKDILEAFQMILLCRTFHPFSTGRARASRSSSNTLRAHAAQRRRGSEICPEVKRNPRSREECDKAEIS